MCGFILAPSHLFRFDAVHRALDAMSYRGADGFRGLSSRGGWTLGHVRLAIQTDADHGAQPFELEDRALAFVGEIFAKDLEALRVDESEALSEALASPNLRGFMALDGFWATAEVYDDGRARVTTDHLGIKPVYYWREFDVFCSELEAMFTLVGARPELDKIYLANCIKWGYDSSGRTPYKGIEQVAPGTAMVHDFHEISSAPTFKPYRYWDWSQVPIGTFNRPPAFLLRDLLTKATRWRAQAVHQRDVALLLSGGLDSTIIHSILSTEGLLEDVIVYSVENGESQFLPSGVTLLPTKESSLPKGLEYIQAPLDLGSLLPQVQLSDALGEKRIRVCLTGDGADEVFGGYSRAQTYDSQASDVFCELPYYHLPRLDRVHMRQTTEIRSPFLAPSVVAFGLRLPWHRRTSKQVLKEAFALVVPDRILNRPKHALKGPQYLTEPLAHRAELVRVFQQRHQQLLQQRT